MIIDVYTVQFPKDFWFHQILSNRLQKFVVERCLATYCLFSAWLTSDSWIISQSLLNLLFNSASHGIMIQDVDSWLTRMSIRKRSKDIVHRIIRISLGSDVRDNLYKTDSLFTSKQYLMDHYTESNQINKFLYLYLNDRKCNRYRDKSKTAGLIVTHLNNQLIAHARIWQMSESAL